MAIALKGLTAQIISAREWLVPLDRPRLEHSSLWFLDFFILILIFLKGVQTIVLHAQIYIKLPVYSFGGRHAVGGSYAVFVESSAIQ
jgi:hypothetical protein